MNEDMMRARMLLFSGGFTCVMNRCGVSFTSEERGVKPLLNWLDSGIDFTGFFAADKVVGKASAFLFTQLKIRGVYAPVMSIGARDILFANGIAVQCDDFAEHIMNRKGDGICPFEAAVENITDPDEALIIIRKKMESMSS